MSAYAANVVDSAEAVFLAISHGHGASSAFGPHRHCPKAYQVAAAPQVSPVVRGLNYTTPSEVYLVVMCSKSGAPGWFYALSVEVTKRKSSSS